MDVLSSLSRFTARRSGRMACATCGTGSGMSDRAAGRRSDPCHNDRMNAKFFRQQPVTIGCPPAVSGSDPRWLRLAVVRLVAHGRLREPHLPLQLLADLSVGGVVVDVAGLVGIGDEV